MVNFFFEEVQMNDPFSINYGELIATTILAGKFRTSESAWEFLG